jgi:hypothetical protein
VDSLDEVFDDRPEHAVAQRFLAHRAGAWPALAAERALARERPGGG